MQWLVTNWFWVLIGVVFMAMHLFGHGGHGGHGGHSGASDSDRQRPGEGSAGDPPVRVSDRNAAGRHHH
ncbi:MAG: DUF2933 domain-containing protein [Acidobacteriota bacterium]